MEKEKEQSLPETMMKAFEEDKSETSICRILYHAFKCMNLQTWEYLCESTYKSWLADEPLRILHAENIIKYRQELLDGKKAEKPVLSHYNWFSELHKQFRIVDFFDGLYREWNEDLVNTDELRAELNKLTKWYIPLFKKCEEDITAEYGDDFRGAYKLLTQKIIDVDSVKYHRYKELTRMRQNTEREGITGHMDMIVYNTINADLKNESVQLMHTTFKKYQNIKFGLDADF